MFLYNVQTIKTSKIDLKELRTTKISRINKVENGFRNIYSFKGSDDFLGRFIDLLA
jgi:hypothetical protein